MLEEKDDNLQPEADGSEKNSETPQIDNQESVTTEETVSEGEVTADAEGENNDDPQNEIDESNAEDAEDEGHKERHEIPMLDYHAMNMDTLVEELNILITKEKIQAIKSHVDQIKSEFDLKFQELLEQKKEDFIQEGGNEIDFNYSSPVKKRFNELYNEYRDKRNQYYKNLEHRLDLNLKNRLDIIEELKGLINVEENINDTYKHFKELQERWRNAGPIPRVNYNDVWRTYHHHVEIFYDFLDLNRDLRDLDFKHNLEEKEKIIAQAESLAEMGDVNKAFRELQLLHKIWKEDLGPVDREHRDAIWDRFSAATKAIHQKRQEYFKNQDVIHEANLLVKQDIIKKIEAITQQKVNNHSSWQKLIKEVEALREEFFNAGRVPYKVNEQTWAAFKEAVRKFNRNKNSFYKGLKKDQQDNLDKKMELVKLAESLKDSDEWEKTTPIMKKIQSDWKNIGHVPRKYSDKIWNEFKSACNHYFDRLHAKKNEHFKDEMEAFEQKKAYLDNLKEFQLSGDKEKDLEQVKAIIADWKAIGRIPHSKKSIEGKFNKILDALFKKLDLDKQKAELIKYGNKLDQLANADNDTLINNERVFIRRKIDEVKSEIRQLENNLQFFNADESNPIVKEVMNNIDKHHEDLNLWKAKLKKLKNINQ
ncbi:protein of unknown function (DUF349) [Galbibacter orientalis DSM 19592]|uniref:DUF349 domain-containing protein n=1 Tax=Galbibacter orientalis DSM 19592 TaxID=926559 RepID=I3C6H1_9FLAO|nr:DUF349 domain-containing protein [Galbibacter orientalis]EIJ39214.1 protein of unknown function (DUF349) [Galbibacter orientalis DSM 19592]